ncbi:MAG TPA: hypothetical protein VFX16_29200 [Pseudonocardiaceae bacterium]|nr:hypothetical protein [Pseudonocardiaceae bacterium]
MSDFALQRRAREDGAAVGEEASGLLTSAASAGGAAGASGVGLQNRVFGWVAAAMVAEQPLLCENLVAGTVVRVGAQTGFAVDDVAAHTDAGNYALFQVKAGMSLGTAEGSPLGKALGQAVEQYLNGRLRSADGTERRVDPLCDALVLCTDSAAPAIVKVHLARALARAGSMPPGTPLEEDLTAPQARALSVVLGHVRRLWVACGHAVPDDEQLRGFVRVLRVVTVDANDGGVDHSAAVARLSRVLPVAGDARAAWLVLVEEGQAASVGREWRDRAAIGVALSRCGVQVSPSVRYAGDIANLCDLSAANLRALQSEAVLPVPGGLYISRGVSARLAAGAGDGNVLVVGDAGAGKSAVLQEFATGRSESQDVVVLRAADVAGANRVQLGAPLPAVLRAWTGQPAVFIIDGVDALRGREDREVLSGVVAGLRGSRWQVVATARTFDARNNPQLQQAFTGLPVSDDPAQVDDQLGAVRHLLVGELTDGELDAAVAPPLALASLLAEAPSELRGLLRNPFNLRLAAQLASDLSDSQHRELLAVHSRVGLLGAYWRRRIRNHQDSTAREALLARLCREMVSKRNLRVVEAEPTVTAADSPAVQALLSENVLSGDGGLFPTARRVLSFSHNILFDYAAAQYMLLDPDDPRRLLDTLDADPSLPLVARPSFDILVDLLWEQRESGAFWPLCLDLAGSRHVLASLAFAARLLSLISANADLQPLEPTPDRGDRLDGLRSAQRFVHYLDGALRTPAVLADPTPALAPLAVLARRLADNTRESYADAALAADLLVGLQQRAPLNASERGADDRGHAVAALLDGCRTDPQRMERLAEVAARQIPHAVGVSVAARGAVDRLLGDDDALRQWGGTVLIWLADAVVATVPHDPDLATRMATAVLTFHETRDEQVNFGGGPLLPLAESRRQQAEHSVYRLCQSFEQLCDADLRVAAEIFCILADDEATQSGSDQWPVSALSVTGWLQYGHGLSMTAHRAGETAAAALSAALTRADPVDVQPVVAVLVEGLHNAAAWAALMTPAGDAIALGRVLLPALESGALLGHPQTHHPAAGLLAALAEHEPILAGRLEAAVLHAHVLIDANGGSQRTKDALTGCLRADAITSPALKARLDELGPDGPPKPIPQMPITSMWEPRTSIDRLRDQGIELQPPIEAAALALSEELAITANGADTRPEAQRQLPTLFTKADRAFSASKPMPPSLDLLLVRAAEALAYDQRVLPGTPLGDRILNVLMTAANSPNAGTLSSAPTAWNPDMRDTAIGGLATLLSRDVWRDSNAGPQIADSVSVAMRDANPLLRMQAARAAAAARAGLSASDRATAIGELVLAEENAAVRTVLLNELRRDVANVPHIVDDILERLLRVHDDTEVEPDEDPERVILDLLTYLALIPKTPFASRAVEQWCRNAPAHAAIAETLAQYMRDYLAPPSRPGQRAAFRLLGVAADASLARWTRNPNEHAVGAGRSEGQRAELHGAGKVAHGIAQQIYFASGAFDEKRDRKQSKPPDLAKFADLAFPILETCAELGDPQCVHPAVQTMVFLAPLNEERALKAIAKAVPTIGPYAGDPTAGDDVIPYLERLLTEQRTLVLFSADGVAAFRHLLATFAAAGNQRALTLAYTFADVFR